MSHTTVEILTKYKELHREKENYFSGWLLYRYCVLWSIFLKIDEYTTHAYHCAQCQRFLAGKDHLCWANNPDNNDDIPF